MIGRGPEPFELGGVNTGRVPVGGSFGMLPFDGVRGRSVLGGGASGRPGALFDPAVPGRLADALDGVVELSAELSDWSGARFVVVLLLGAFAGRGGSEPSRDGAGGASDPRRAVEEPPFGAMRPKLCVVFDADPDDDDDDADDADDADADAAAAAAAAACTDDGTFEPIERPDEVIGAFCAGRPEAAAGAGLGDDERAPDEPTAGAGLGALDRAFAGDVRPRAGVVRPALSISRPCGGVA